MWVHITVAGRRVIEADLCSQRYEPVKGQTETRGRHYMGAESGNEDEKKVVKK